MYISNGNIDSSTVVDKTLPKANALAFELKLCTCNL